MGRKQQLFMRGAVMAVTAVLAGALAARAQTTGAEPSKDPRNLQGTWMAASRAHLTKDFVPHMGRPNPDDIPDSEITWAVGDKMPPFTPWGKAKFDEAVDAQVNNHPHADPSTNCMPHGLPRLMIAPYGLQIVQTKDTIALMHAVNHNVRLIHMNAKMPAKVPITFNGYSVGHWEGDALVVQSKGISGAGPIDQLGTPHSDQLQVTERIRKINDGKNFEDMMTFDDPIAFTQPWTARIIDNWDNGHRISEYVCEENNRNAADAEGHTAVR